MAREPGPIVLLVTQLEAGGAQVAALRLAGELRARGYKAETWFLYRKRDVFRDEPHVHVLFEGPPKNRGVDYSRIAWRLFRRLRATRPSALASFTHYANVLGQSIGLLTHVPIRVASQRNPRESYPPSVQFIDSLFGTFGVYTSVVAVSATTAASFNHCPKRYRKLLRVVHNGVEPCEPGFTATDARRQMGWPTNRVVGVVVGRLSEQKNHTTLLRAMKHVPDVTLVLVGEGELRSALEDLACDLGIDDRVQFLGELDRSDVRRVLTGADMFLMPSLFEGLSNALLEAISCGVAVLASDIPSQREVLVDGDGNAFGVLVPPTDVLAWTTALKRLACDLDLRREWAAKARTRSQAFTVARMIDGFEAVLNPE